MDTIMWKGCNVTMSGKYNLQDLEWYVSIGSLILSLLTLKSLHKIKQIKMLEVTTHVLKTSIGAVWNHFVIQNKILLISFHRIQILICVWGVSYREFWLGIHRMVILTLVCSFFVLFATGGTLFWKKVIQLNTQLL